MSAAGRVERHREVLFFFGVDMPLPLDGCWAKIDRANENITNLQAAIAARFQPYIIAGNVNHETKECVFVANAKTIPLRLSVLAGEIIHHLRSSLDHLICALVLQQSNVVNLRHAFPVCLDEKDFKSTRTRKKIE